MKVDQRFHPWILLFGRHLRSLPLHLQCHYLLGFDVYQGFTFQSESFSLNEPLGIGLICFLGRLPLISLIQISQTIRWKIEVTLHPHQRL